MQWVKEQQKDEKKRVYNISRVFDYDVYRNGTKIWEAPEYNGKNAMRMERKSVGV